MKRVADNTSKNKEKNKESFVQSVAAFITIGKRIGMNGNARSVGIEPHLPLEL